MLPCYERTVRISRDKYLSSRNRGIQVPKEPTTIGGCVAYWLPKLRKVCFLRGIQQFRCMGNYTTFARVHQ